MEGLSRLCAVQRLADFADREERSRTRFLSFQRLVAAALNERHQAVQVSESLFRRLAGRALQRVQDLLCGVAFAQSVSQVARTGRPMRGQCFFRMRIKFAGDGITLDCGVELLGVERFEPGAEPRQLARRKLFDSLLKVFGSGHGTQYSIGGSRAKGVGCK